MKTTSSVLRLFTGGIVLAALFVCSASGKPKPRLKLLVFSKTAGFHHGSIPAGNAALVKMGKENDFDVDTTVDASVFNSSGLKQYAAVVFLNTTGDVLDSVQQAAFTAYIRAGGGYAGVHAASDTEYDWPWFGKLTGAYFVKHPKPQEAVLHVVDGAHVSTQHLPAGWKRFDEWYNFKDLNPDVHVLLMLDESSYQGGSNGNYHPIAWYHNYEGGRAWYTGLGHTPESYAEELFLKHLLGGLRYAMGS